jgi:hypothetical protein
VAQLLDWALIYASFLMTLPVSGVDLSCSDLEREFARLASTVEGLGYTGWELDDFLASPAVRKLTFGNLLAKRVAIQLGERLPLNLRSSLRVPKLESAKANGFFARGYIHAFRATRDERWLSRAVTLLDRLLDLAAPGYSGLGWGNAFDFASRGGFFPAGVPTVVWTAQISKAFELGHEETGYDRYADAVVSSARFVLRDLERHMDRNGVCIAYAPGRRSLIHNSNLLGAVALLRGWKLVGDAESLEVARSAFAWSLAHHQSDGSWLYGVGRQWEWIDNFHTAYVLDCLREGHAIAGVVPFAAVDSTYRYWRDTFFLPDGAPRYYHDRTYPLDIQCAAQAIATLATCTDLDADAVNRAHRVLRWANYRLRRRDGLYGFRRGRLLPNRLVTIHWGQSTMLEALGLMLEHCHAEASS